MKIIEKIIVQKETVSDSEYLISEILVSSGQIVNKGDIIFTMETSKADIEIEINFNGILLHNLDLGRKIYPGDLVAIVCDKLEDDKLSDFLHLFQKKEEDLLDLNKNVGASKKALKLLKKYNLSATDIRNSGIIKEIDVIKYIESKSENIIDLSKYDNAEENDVILIGGKGGAKMVIDALWSTNKFTPKLILDDDISPGEKVKGIPVIGGTGILNKLYSLGYKNIILCFGTIFKRENRLSKYYLWKEMGFKFPNVIHQQANIEPSLTLGEGNIILAGSVVGSDAVLGDINFINTGSILSHECRLTKNVHLAPGSVLGGRVSVEKNTLIGMNATIYFDIEIGENVTINNGLTIIKNVKNNEFVK